MPPGLLATERTEFYLYDVMRLAPLRAPGVTLTPIAPDSLGQAGLRVQKAGRPDVDIFVDGEGRLAHLRTKLPDTTSGALVQQDIWLAGIVEAEGVRWPKEIRLTQNGAPYFDLSVRTLRVLPRLQDPLLRGPR